MLPVLVGVEVGQGAFVEEFELAVDCFSVLALEHLEQQAELGDLDGLRVDVHAVDVVEQDSLRLGRGQAPVAALGAGIAL